MKPIDGVCLYVSYNLRDEEKSDVKMGIFTCVVTSKCLSYGSISCPCVEILFSVDNFGGFMFNLLRGCESFVLLKKILSSRIGSIRVYEQQQLSNIQN